MTAQGLVLLALVLAPLAAQARQPAVGTVADAAGKPVAGAEVVLWWTPYGELLGPETDRVTVTTDARGRFVANLLPQRGYSAFARGPLQPNGRAVVSVVRDAVAAHANIALPLTVGMAPHTVRVRGADAWPDEAPLRLVAVPVAENTLAVEVALVDGQGTIPPMPPLSGVVVLDAHGEPLWCQRNSLLGMAEVVLPPPQLQRVRVLDGGGAPAGGAEVLLDLGTVMTSGRWALQPLLGRTWRRVGISGADGTATLRLPLAGEPESAGCTLLARRDGFSATVSGSSNGQWFVDGRAAPMPADAVLPLHLQPLQRLRIEQGEQRLVAHGVSIAGNIDIDLGKQAFERTVMSTPIGQRGIADGDGWITPWLGGTCADFHVRLDPLALPEATTATIAEARIVRAPGDVTIDVDRLRHVRVQVLDRSGGPAVAVPVFVLLHEQKLQRLPPCITDAAGRVDLRLGDGGWLVLAWTEEGMAMRWLDAKAAGGDWRLSLAPLPRMQLRVIDANGRPVAGAKTGLQWGQSRPVAANDEQAMLLGLEETMMQRLVVGAGSDAQGLIDVPLFPFARMGWQVNILVGSDVRAALELEPTDSPRDVVLK